RPTEQEEPWPGHCRNVETEFDNTMQGPPEQAEPQEEKSRFVPAFSVKKREQAGNRRRKRQESDQARVRRLLEVIVVNQSGHLRCRRFEFSIRHRKRSRAGPQNRMGTRDLPGGSPIVKPGGDAGCPMAEIRG